MSLGFAGNGNGKTLPRVSVVMPVYNGQAHLQSAVASILVQDFGDFELIAVNDGSTDQSAAMLEAFAGRDPRVRVIHQENRGLVGALNRGLHAARCPLIARMDADDISMPERFGKQVRFLDAHPNVLAVGTAILNMDSDGDALNVQIFETASQSIDQCLMNRRTGMAHPSVMMRREPVMQLGGYRAEFEWIEDHDLWLRLAEHGQLSNLPDVLLCYRQHPSSCSWNNSALRARRINGVMIDAYRRRGLAMPQSLMLRESQVRSAGGPHKWVRAAARAGQWKTARKHLVTQWRSRPLSPLTWRSSLEAAVRGTATWLGGAAAAPSIPTFSATQLGMPHTYLPHTQREESMTHSAPTAAKRPLLGRLRMFVERKIAKRRQRHLPPQQVFADIYRLNAWKSGESISGLGSELSQTQRVIESLPQWFARLDVQRIIDIPCGDFHWMSQVDLSGVEYLGCDIVDELIEANQRYASDNIRFEKLDLLSDPLPQADLIFCRDCLVHFSFAHVRQALDNIAASGARYLMTTTFTERTHNEDISTGRWRPLNLSAAPFSLPQPQALLVEACTQDEGRYADKALAVWPIEQLREQLRRAA